MKEKFKERFRLNVNTVVCAANYTEIEVLSEYMWENFQLDGQYFNIIRGETLVGDEIKQVPPRALPGIYAQVSKLTRRYGDRMFAEDEASQTLRQERGLRRGNHDPLSHATAKLSAANCLALSLYGGRNDSSD